jgi:glyoxylase-like metal-dependent hydrolase (beta-lactamase superfamily II)
MHLKVFTFNPFQENTYLLWDDSGKGVIVDPGNSHTREDDELVEAVENLGLKPVAIWLTHAHADHVCGTAFLARRFQLPVAVHPQDVRLLENAPFFATLFGFSMEVPPRPSLLVEEGRNMRFGNTSLEVRHIPGHSPGHVVYIHHESRQVLAGDVLFRESIGRTDLPGGNHELLISGIRQKLLTLPDNYVVWAGHGPATTIGHERRFNPFLAG